MLLKRLMSYIPTQLPVGVSEFDAWAQDIMDLAGPMADEDSMKFVIASSLLHIPIKKDGFAVNRIAKSRFVASLRKGGSNQVASQVFSDIKEKQARKAQEKQAQEAAQAAAETAAQETSAQSVQQ